MNIDVNSHSAVTYITILRGRN